MPAIDSSFLIAGDIYESRKPTLTLAGSTDEDGGETEGISLEVEFGGGFQPKVRFDLVYTEEDVDGRGMDDDVSCDPTLTPAEAAFASDCTYIGSVTHDLEALFEADGGLELQLRNKHDELWDSRLEYLRAKICLEPCEVSFQCKNPDFLSTNPDFLLKNDDFTTDSGRRRRFDGRRIHNLVARLANGRC